MNTALISFVGNWTLSLASSPDAPIETYQLIAVPDTGDPTLLDGVIPMPGGPDLTLHGRISADGRIWLGQASLPSSGAAPFLLVLATDGASAGGTMTLPTTMTAYALQAARNP